MGLLPVGAGAAVLGWPDAAFAAAREASGPPGGACTATVCLAAPVDGSRTVSRRGTCRSGRPFSGLTVQQAERFSGTFGARGATIAAATFARRTLAAGETGISFRTRLKVVSKSTTADVLRLRTAAGTPIVTVFVGNAPRLGYVNDVAGQTRTSNSMIQAGAWRLLELRVRVAGASSTVSVLLDGVAIGALTRTESLGSAAVSSVELGNSVTGRIYDIAFDDVVVARI